MAKEKISYYQLNGDICIYEKGKLKNLINHIREAAYHCFELIKEEELKVLADRIFDEAYRCSTETGDGRTLSNDEWRECVKTVLSDRPEVLLSYLNANKDVVANLERKISEEIAHIMINGDKSNGSVDSKLASTRRALKYEAVEKVQYREFILTKEEKEALDDGYIYIHDMGARRDMINCCLFDMEKVLTNGFEMGNVWYEEPDSLSEAFDVIASVTMSNASQIYGGFTVGELDNLLSKYAEKSYDRYIAKYSALGLDQDAVEKAALDEIRAEFDRGFKSIEYRFNTVISSRGDYPFITISFGLCRNRFAEMAVESVLRTRMNGQGKEGFKRPVLFPKLVFLFDKELHSKGKRLEYLFEQALDCSSKVMYPEFLSLTGEGYVSSMYKKYGSVISPICCRAFLSPWYERGGRKPADEDDKPIYTGRFNYGVVSMNLPMIYKRAQEEKKPFYEVLDYYLEMIRGIHKNTYAYLSKMKAFTNPVAFTQGGFYGGCLQPDDSIEPLLRSANVSFGVTALNELQRLHNGRSLYEDGEFALEVMKYINKKAEDYTEADGILYNVYGTPAEKLCGVQVKKFRSKYGKITNVSDREFVSNSFHCHVSEDISPIQKQDKESRFWDYFNGGKIQYIRIKNSDNREAIRNCVLHAMELGLYEGINLSLVFCDECGMQLNQQHVEACPECGSKNITKVERMCGFLSFTRIHGDTRLNEAKMAEIAVRKSM